MPEVIFAGPEGRLEGRYSPNEEDKTAPIALILHPHPRAGGHMDHRIPAAMYDIYKRRGFAVLKFNFRGVGRSQGLYDNGVGELQDAAYALDWVQSLNQNAAFSWVTGYSFGSWIGMQLLMRRPEIKGFVSISLPVNTYDFSFLAPCPASGIVPFGSADAIVPPHEVENAIPKIRVQKGMVIRPHLIEGADHFYTNHQDELVNVVENYLDEVLDPKYCPPRPPSAPRLPSNMI